MVNLTILAIFQNEAPYLAEWLAFHLAQGVERFVLFDNRSTDGWREVVAKFKDVVDVIPWYLPQPCQVPAYVSYFQGVHQARGGPYRASRWVAVLDIDEFLCPAPGEPKLLREILADYAAQGVAGLGVNWMIYNGYTQYAAPPSGLQIDAYTLRCKDDHDCNNHIKSIVDPLRATGIRNPHEFTLNGPMIDELGRPLKGHLTQTPTHTRLRINHYFIRSRQEWETKVAKGRADNGTKRTPDEWKGYPALVEDRSAGVYSEQVRQILAERSIEVKA